MAKTNTAKRPDRHTHEGGPAKRIDAEAQLRRSVTACLLWENTFYEDGVEIAERIAAEAADCSTEFITELATYVRTQHGVRHAPLWLAAACANRGDGKVRPLVFNVINRADELAEFVAMYWKDGKRPLPRAVKLGLADAFAKFDEYQFAKYDRDGDVRLRDVLFLTHPKPADKEREALYTRIAERKLATPDTWETNLSSGADKAETFSRLLASGKLGYLACLRNLRNMLDAGVSRELISARLLDGRGRRGVLPFQFIAAALMVPQMEGVLDGCMALALDSLPKLGGRTAVIIDASASMDAKLSGRSILSRADAATGIGLMAIGMCDDARCFAFGNTCAEVPARPSIALRDAVRNAGVGHWTQLGNAVMYVLTAGEFDRIIAITDEQTADKLPTPTQVPHRYVINVASNRNGVGYHDWTHIDGFSEATLKYISEIENEHAAS